MSDEKDWEDEAIMKYEAELRSRGFDVVDTQTIEVEVGQEEDTHQAISQVLSRLLDTAVALYAEASNKTGPEAWRAVLELAEHNTAVEEN